MRLFFLDGLRGWLCLLVVFHHIGGPSVDGTAWDATLPFHDGDLAVRSFFVISAFSLSRVSAKRIPATLLSRYTRLALPCFAATLAASVLAACAGAPTVSYASMFLYPVQVVTESFFVVKTPFFPRFATCARYTECMGVTWTMRVEMAGSFLVFAYTALQASLRRKTALAFVVLVMLCLTDYNVSYFVHGLVVAHHFDGPCETPRPWLAASLLAAALLGAYTSLLKKVMPASAYLVMHELQLVLRCYSLFGAVWLSPRLQRALETKLSLWLGRMSFSIYLIHAQIIALLSPSSRGVDPFFVWQPTGAPLVCAVFALSLLCGWIFHFAEQAFHVARLGEVFCVKAEDVEVLA